MLIEFSLRKVHFLIEFTSLSTFFVYFQIYSLIAVPLCLNKTKLSWCWRIIAVDLAYTLVRTLVVYHLPCLCTNNNIMSLMCIAIFQMLKDALQISKHYSFAPRSHTGVDKLLPWGRLTEFGRNRTANLSVKGPPLYRWATAAPKNAHLNGRPCWKQLSTIGFFCLTLLPQLKIGIGQIKLSVQIIYL